MLRILLACVLSSRALAQGPVVYGRTVVNAASFMPQGLPGGAIAQGSIFSLFGSNIGPSQGVSATSFPLAITVAGVGITVSQGNVSVNAIPIYVSSGQINAIMPSNAPTGLASLRVTVNSARSNAVPVRIATSAVGIFAANSAGSGPGILQNFVGPGVQPINQPTVPAIPGQTITLWGTGLGPVRGADNVAPPGGDLGIKTEVFVGGKPALVTYSGRATCCSGTDQVNFIVPDSAPNGCWVPVYVRTSGANISNFVTMAISTDGSACTEGADPLATALVAGGKTGSIAMVRASTREDIGTVAPIEVSTDFAVAGYSSISSTPFAFHPALSLPPLGACTEYSGHADLLKSSFVGLALPPPGTNLNAGAPAVISGPGGSYNLIPVFTGYHGAIFGSSAGITSLMGNLSLTPGTYNVRGGGGSDVGTFSATIDVPQPIVWTNRNALVRVPRSQPLTISWTGGGANDIIGVLGIAADMPTNAAAAFACLAQPGASSLTIPADVLANVPPTQPYVVNSTGVLYLVSVPQSALTALSASGLDTGFALFSYVNGKTVIFQ